ncbi:aquaporin-like protein [Aspergillus minisclerotigenes]|uniref:Aquaporin-like protein n=1 Tax=Aspergillus minisclerotigenes TaxID=656917 RepID=A0A5N6JKJ8_9EURO|nr:aquaporin-like protein [Aspergillus minisclerotigenes]
MPSWIHQRRGDMVNDPASRNVSTTSSTPIMQALAARIRSQPGGNTAPIVRSEKGQLPMLHVPHTFQNNFVAVVGEFVGTFMFLFFAFAGGQVSNTPKPAEGAAPNTSNLLYLSLSFGFSLLVNVWTFYRVTGGLFNPVVTLALCLCGGMHPVRGVLVFASQIIAGIASAGVVSCLFPGPLSVGTRLGGGTSISQGLFIEMFLTAHLVFVVIMLAVVKQKSTFLAPVGIGLVLFVNQLVGTYYTGCALNPARALGPDVINRSFPGYHWIYWVGPLLGSLLASGFYGFLCIFHYETVNPGQDFNQWEAAAGPGPWHEVINEHSGASNHSHLSGDQPTLHQDNVGNTGSDSGPADKEYGNEQV